MAEIGGPHDARPFLNPFEPGFHDDPYPHYASLREEAPIHRLPVGMWVLTRWADVEQVLRTPGTSVDDDRAASVRRMRALTASLREERPKPLADALYALDPPAHSRLRQHVGRAYTAATRPEAGIPLGAIVDRLLDDLEARGGRVDLISDFAFPLPFTVMASVLGLPVDESSEQVRAWSSIVSGILDPTLAISQVRPIDTATNELLAYLSDVVRWKRGRVDDDADLIGTLLRAQVSEGITDAELLHNIAFLLLAGHETTVGLIGNGVASLLSHPDQLAAVATDPTLGGGAVDELLRFESPVQFSRRVVVDPIEVDGQELEPGEFVLAGIGAANRDPRRFGTNADELDVRRPAARHHLAFGGGIHHCLGTSLARRQGVAAIGRLVRRFPDLALAEAPRWRNRLVLRSLERLVVDLGTAASPMA